jgi:hypothetical protein
MPFSILSATSRAVKLPLNESGAITNFIFMIIPFVLLKAQNGMKPFSLDIIFIKIADKLQSTGR